MFRTVEQPGCFRISANARACKSCIESRVFANRVPALLRSVGDLALQVIRLMIATDLAQGRLIELKHYLAQFRGFRMPGRKALPVNFAQRPNQGVAVLAADFAIFVGMAMVETRFAHAALPLAPVPIGYRLSLR